MIGFAGDIRHLSGVVSTIGNSSWGRGSVRISLWIVWLTAVNIGPLQGPYLDSLAKLWDGPLGTCYLAGESHMRDGSSPVAKFFAIWGGGLQGVFLLPDRRDQERGEEA